MHGGGGRRAALLSAQTKRDILFLLRLPPGVFLFFLAGLILLLGGLPAFGVSCWTGEWTPGGFLRFSLSRPGARERVEKLNNAALMALFTRKQKQGWLLDSLFLSEGVLLQHVLHIILISRRAVWYCRTLIGGEVVKQVGILSRRRRFYVAGKEKKRAFLFFTIDQGAVCGLF